VGESGSVLGRGIAFPPRVGADGRMAWSEGEANIREAIQIILATDRGERVRRPDFGAGVGRYLFEPNTAATHSQLEQEITQALSAWEPRVAVETVDAHPDPDDLEAAIATITYTLVATQAAETITLAVALTT
jgi:phage baseplate assembly protein W